MPLEHCALGATHSPMSRDNALSNRTKVGVLFVCLANICRSPTAEAVFRKCVKEAGLAEHIVVASAGTRIGRSGEAPDPRACRVAARRGYDLTGLRTRRLRKDDFSDFDYIVVMDIENMRALAPLCPSQEGHKVKLFTDFCSQGGCTISDPYFGGEKDFAHMLDRIEDGASGLLHHIACRLGKKTAS